MQLNLLIPLCFLAGAFAGCSPDRPTPSATDPGPSPASTPPPTPQVQADHTLTPEDLMMKKWRFEATPNPGEVFVLRQHITLNGQPQPEVPDEEIIMNSPGKPCRAWVLLEDESFFGQGNGHHNYLIMWGAPESNLWGAHSRPSSQLRHSEGSGTVVNLIFDVDEGRPELSKETVEYSVQVVPYGTEKAKIPDLPPADQEFTRSYNPAQPGAK